MPLDLSTFFSVWYWIALAGFWSALTHWTHGVPAGVMLRAARDWHGSEGGEAAALCDAMTRDALARTARGLARWGVAGAAGGVFGLTVLAMAGLWAGWEPAAGVFAAALPAVAMAAAQYAEAARLAAAPPPPRELLRVLFRRRWINQVFAFGGIALAVTLFALRHWDRLVFLGGWERF